MTKRKVILICALAGFCAGLSLWLLKKPVEKPFEVKAPAPILPNEPVMITPKIDVKNLKIDGKKVLGLRPGKESQDIQNVHMANLPSTEWEEKLEENLRNQGGAELQDVELKKVESLVLVQDDMALNVESVIVTLKHTNNEKTIFRVLVDSQTGKVLKNWDQPVRDPANPRENFGVKLDPRYHNE